MSEPHHYVFNELERTIWKEIPFDLLKPHLLARGVVSDELVSKCTARPKRAVTILTSVLRNKNFDVFVDFVQCIIDAELDAEQGSETVDFSVVDSITSAVKHFDSTHESHHADKIPVRGKSITELQASQQENDPPPLDQASSLYLPMQLLMPESSTQLTSLPPASASSVQEPHSPLLLKGTKVDVSSTIIDKTGSVSDVAAADSIMQASSVEPAPPQHQRTSNKGTAERSFLRDTSIIPQVKGMPLLPYALPISSKTFNSSGGQMYISAANLSIDVPPNAVCKDDTVTLSVGSCVHGPFKLPKESYRITDIFCIVADGTFSAPVTITIPHCIQLPEYKLSHDITILRADHTKVNDHKVYEFQEVCNPEISNTMPYLSFQLSEFCILCGIYQPSSSHTEVVSQSSTESCGGSAPSRLMRQMALDECFTPSPSPQSSLESKDASFDFPHQHNPQRQISAPIDADCQSERSPVCSSSDSFSSTRKLGKREHPCDLSTSVEENKRQRKIVYALLFFQPKSQEKFPSDVFIYACEDCPVSVKVCKDQMSKKGMDAPLLLEACLLPETKEFSFEIADFQSDCWDVVLQYPPSPKVHESDIQLHQNSQKLRYYTEESRYPPRIIYRIMPKPTWKNAANLNCNVLIHGAVDGLGNSLSFSISMMLPLSPSSQEPNVSVSSRQGSSVELVKSLSQEHKDLMCRRVTRSAILEVANKIQPKHWKDLLHCLGLEESEIETIDMDCARQTEGVRECCVKGLYKWIQQSKDIPSFQKLCNALDYVNEAETAVFIIEKLSELS